MKLSVVVPIYNEVESIPDLVQELQASCKELAPFEVICVDDGSTDGSVGALKEGKAAFPELKIVQLEKHVGKSDALAAAFEIVKGENIVTIDGDLQNVPAEIPKLVEALDTYDVALGWRSGRKSSLLKRFASRFANAFRARLLYDRAHDSGCGFKAFRKSALENLTLYKGMHRFFPALCRMNGCSITEVRITDRERRFGDSKYGTLTRGIPGFFDLLAVAWMRRRKLSYSIKSID